ncbi:MAG TPA: site-2 protease family protein [Mycobacteriales bacterium]|nr:site-2 protease family protein [Mycobacteriales bacterium]
MVLLQGALFFLDSGGALLGILLGFVVGIVARSVGQAAVADRLGDRQARVAGRLSPDPRRHLDPFGVVAVLIAGVGWGKPVPFDERRLGRSRYLLVLAVGPLVQLLLAYAAFAAWRGYLGADPQSDAGFVSGLLVFFALVNVGCAVLSLVPLPPLDANRALWSLAPRTAGWQRARYYSEEQNYGLAALVVLLLPLFSGVGLIMRLVHAVGGPVVRLMLLTLGVN